MSSSPHIPSQHSPLVKGAAAPVPEESFVEHWLIMPKILYFVLNLFVYGFHSLLFFLFVDQWGFKNYQFGYATLILAMNFFGAMVWTSLADRTGRYKSIIILTAVGYTIVSCIMLSFKGASSGHHGAHTELPFWTAVMVFVGFGFFNLFLSACFPLVDAMILGMLSSNHRVSKEQFGNQRMFGAVGHFTATLLSLTVYDKKNTLNTLIFQLVVSTLFIVVVWFGVKDVQPVKGGHHGGHSVAKKEDKGKEALRAAPIPTPSPSPVSSILGTHQVPVAQALPMAPTPAPPSAADELAAEGQGGVKHPVIALLTDPNFLFFMLFIACLGVVRSVSSSFQKPIAYSINKDSKFQTGLIDFGRMVSEIFVYKTAKYMKNSMGIYWVLIFSQVMGILRLIGYGIVPTKVWYAYYVAWGMELIKGFSSGMISSSAIPIASRIAPPGCENTAQGLFSGMYSGLSMGLGGIIGGGILHYYYETDANQIQDVQWMFVLVSIGTAVVTALMTLKYIFVDRVCGIPGFPRRSSLPA